MKTIIKAVITLIMVITIQTTAFAQSDNYQLSTHILDVSIGQPATQVPIELYQLDKNDVWRTVSKKETDSNGRIKDFLPTNSDNKGTYKLKFDTKSYFNQKRTESLYPFVEIVFEIKDNSHYHIPLTLSPYGYSTYRGS
ncbi:hydroxyisourate hydrolase [Tychonema sp. LEGE 07199]|uniref:hydroxyisourate hydrolase n=1 Tax=unclassified Tychonema TaxID=2642144 RepID=UPI00187F73F2|nr:MULTISPECIES: hydroxyisourate hydrolase [unclassified Tychonema]MBE9123107.1 hydroxyisourate hydrolase [Tychonema sp. LEGE 07199]MBE9132128.1 hydroxyisourate hydrolase [Tychonema sp. LEGE 07196]